MKPILTLLISLLTTSMIFAQLGIKAGVNASTVRLENELGLSVSNKQAATGWQTGLFYRLELSGALAVQPEILYVERGTEFEIFNVPQSRTEAMVEGETKYVEVPVLLMLKLGDLPLNIQAGVYGAYLTDVEYTFTDGLFDVGVQQVDNNPENYNRSDWGFVGGVGIEFLNVNIDLRYTQGWQPAEGAFQYRNVAYLETARNDALMLNIGYRFW